MPHSWKDIKLGRNQGLPEMPHSNMKGIKLPGMRVTAVRKQLQMPIGIWSSSSFQQ
ncbi:hypothetical protein FH972_006513 [Carpinus fangiana]|uniref:Uncharacterized protein n=1 Tax=Carpinus fangiana TaxID=176857 RepID=A0A5N6QVS3_9ROSI|nr:hypothetical protein FH972_006513 [Carpinus fangiana]